MKHSKFYPARQGDQVIWLQNFGGRIGSFATALGLTTAQITALVADCLWLVYLLESWLPAVAAVAVGLEEMMCRVAINESFAVVILNGGSQQALPWRAWQTVLPDAVYLYKLA